MDIDIRSIIDKYPKANVIHTTDYRNRTDTSHINAGVFLIKHTDWAKSCLEEIFAKGSFLNSQSDRRATESWLHEGNQERYQELFQIVDFKLFNSIGDSYEEGDFVIHLAGDGPKVPGMLG